MESLTPKMVQVEEEKLNLIIAERDSLQEDMTSIIKIIMQLINVVAPNGGGMDLSTITGIVLKLSLAPTDAGKLDVISKYVDINEVLKLYAKHGNRINGANNTPGEK